MSQEVAPAMSSDNDHKILSVAEAAKVLRIGRNSCYELVPRGEIPRSASGGRSESLAPGSSPT
jgi:excisionase family DNA binding protein